MSSHNYSHLIFNKEVKQEKYTEEKAEYSTNGAEKNTHTKE